MSAGVTLCAGSDIMGCSIQDTFRDGRPFRVALERENGRVSVFSSFLRGAEYAEANLRYMERYVKFLLWSVGTWRITVMLPDEKARRVGQSIAAASLPEV